jgi:hypothetical protein
MKSRSATKINVNGWEIILNMIWRRALRTFLVVFIAIALCLPLTSCGTARRSGSAEPTLSQKLKQVGAITEVSPPSAIQELEPFLDNYQPQIKILGLKPDEVIDENTISVNFRVKDLPLFQSPSFNLGPHLHAILDNQSYQRVYDLSQPLVLKDLEPGTHTLRVFASRPWHESFKNEEAYDQVTFHVLTKTGTNNPSETQPLLTYSRPTGTYGAEPILLDFYLTSASHPATPATANWQIHCTINGQSFMLDRWQPVYLKGFKPGKNWVQLELLDSAGNPTGNVYNNTVRVITYQPDGQDALARLVRGELKLDVARAIVDPNYKPPQPKPTAAPIPAVTSPPSMPVVPPKPETLPVPTATVSPAPLRPEMIPVPVVPSPAPTARAVPGANSPKPLVEKTVPPAVNPSPKATLEPKQPQKSAEPPSKGWLNRLRDRTPSTREAPSAVKPLVKPTPTAVPSITDVVKPTPVPLVGDRLAKPDPKTLEMDAKPIPSFTPPPATAQPQSPADEPTKAAPSLPPRQPQGSAIPAPGSSPVTRQPTLLMDKNRIKTTVSVPTSAPEPETSGSTSFLEKLKGIKPGSYMDSYRSSDANEPDN